MRLIRSSELEEILRRFKSTASLQSDLDFDVLQCTWNDVLRELERAQDAAAESESSGKKLHRKVWRGLGTTGADIFGPGLAALPDELGVLHGGLALIFTVSLAQNLILSDNRLKASNSSLGSELRIGEKF